MIIKIEDLLNLYSVVELWAHGIRDIDALISARAKLDELIKIKELRLTGYLNVKFNEYAKKFNTKNLVLVGAAVFKVLL